MLKFGHKVLNNILKSRQKLIFPLQSKGYDFAFKVINQSKILDLCRLQNKFILENPSVARFTIFSQKEIGYES